MWIAVLNNFSDVILGGIYTCVIFYAGSKYGRWRERRKR